VHWLPFVAQGIYYSRNHPVKIDGHTLTTAAVVATARYFASVELDDRKEIKQRVEKTRQVVVDKVASGTSVYGLSTGFGGSGKPYSLHISHSVVVSN
jgi:phenylalanine ammonia-lyase